MSMAKEFREFAVKGNVIDLAVGVIIGGAFGKIVDSLVKDNPGIADVIEKAIRQNAGLIAEQFLDRGGPEDAAEDAIEA